jgi:hypothetical protein
MATRTGEGGGPFFLPFSWAGADVTETERAAMAIKKYL